MLKTKKWILIICSVVFLFGSFIFINNLELNGSPTIRSENGLIVGPVNDEKFKELISNDYVVQQAFLTNESFIVLYSVNHDEQHTQRVQFNYKINSSSITYECLSLDGSFTKFIDENLDYDELKSYVKSDFCSTYKYNN